MDVMSFRSAGLVLLFVALTTAAAPAARAPHRADAASRPAAGTLQSHPRQSSKTESPQMHQAALEAEKRFAEQITQQFNIRMPLVETDHFAVWTTLADPQQHQMLARQCEAMYAALQRIFQVPADEPVFLGKCGVFVLANQHQFQAFCRSVQQIPSDRAEHALGFHCGLPDGRSRIIAFWPGNLQDIAEVLVHEGSHAFLQRYGGNGRVITWFNEGLAEHVTAMVFPKTSPQGRDAMQHAVNLLRNDPQVLQKLLALEDGPMPGEYYPLAQSVVAFLIQANGEAFVRIIPILKNTEPFAQALQKAYQATLGELDTHWRRWLLQTAQSGRPRY